MTTSTRVAAPAQAPPGSSAGRPTGTNRWVSRVAVAVGLLALATRGWVAWHGYYYLDDFVFMAKAVQHHPFDPHYLLEPYNSHLMPGSYLWVWALTHALPFNYGAVVVTTMLLQAALAVLFYSLLRRLFGSTLLVLVPFAVFVLSPVTLPATLWWAAAVNQVPQQLAMVTVLLAHTAYLRTGRLRQGLAGPLALVGGLLFSEKTLLVVPLVVALTLAFFTEGSPWQRVLRGGRTHLKLWIAYAAVAVPYTAYYLIAVPSPARHPGQGAGIVQLVMESFGRAVLPGLLGGPWTWVQIGYAGALADPSPFAAAVAVVVTTGVVVATCLLRRHAWRGWALALGYALLNLVLLVVSRAAFIGPVIADEYRYVTDLALVAALGLGLATIPLAGRWHGVTATRLEPRESVRSWLQGPSVRELVAELPRPGLPAGALAVVVALAASATWSTLAYDRYWRVNPARPYVQTARAELSGAGSEPVLAEGYVPPEVAWALLGRYATVGELLSPLPHPPRTLADGPASDTLWMLDARGRLQRAAVSGFDAKAGPDKECGWRLGQEAVRIPMRRETLPFSWTLRIGYLASRATSAVVTVNGKATTVPFHAGVGAVFLGVQGAVSEIAVSPVADEGVTVCTDDVVVGAPVPVGGS